MTHHPGHHPFCSGWMLEQKENCSNPVCRGWSGDYSKFDAWCKKTFPASTVIKLTESKSPE